MGLFNGKIGSRLQIALFFLFYRNFKSLRLFWPPPPVIWFNDPTPLPSPQTHTHTPCLLEPPQVTLVNITLNTVLKILFGLSGMKFKQLLTTCFTVPSTQTKKWPYWAKSGMSILVFSSKMTPLWPNIFS